MVIPTFPAVRVVLSAPLVVHNPTSRGDCCYILASGGAMWERLDAAADLLQMGRVNTLLVMREDAYGQFSFKANASWTRTQWMADYLAWRGIPADRIRWMGQIDELFGTLKEARAVARDLPRHVKSLVIVSSAPHMRRALLAFRRSLPADVAVIPYAATEIENSYELNHPIWLEYLKLLVYYVIA
ncbi:MAG: YdcF family protein [Desulfuromonadaceae bacterium]|nr:YdcF family protein [Desulfuromonadaceae bacterium]